MKARKAGERRQRKGSRRKGRREGKDGKERTARKDGGKIRRGKGGLDVMGTFSSH